MDKDSDKEGGIEIRDSGCWTDTETPGETLDPIGCIVWFTSVGPPAGGKEAVTVSGLDVGWVLDGSPGELGEGFTPFEGSLSLHFEATFLRHGGIKTREASVNIFTGKSMGRTYMKYAVKRVAYKAI